MLNATFSNIMVTSFSGGGSRSIRREPLCTLFCNLQSRARTHTISVIGLYELLGNPTFLEYFYNNNRNVHHGYTTLFFNTNYNIKKKVWFLSKNLFLVNFKIF